MREEITLREMIEMVLKKKMIICLFTVVCLLISLFYSLFFYEPEYSASSVLLANPIESKQINMSSGINEMIDSLAVYPYMTIETYKEQVISSKILSEIINDLKLTDKNGKSIRWTNLVNKIDVDIVNNTNLLKITVKDKDPELAAKLANGISSKLIDYISENTRKFAEQAKFEIEVLLKEEEVKLEEQSKKLQEYLAKSHNIEQMKLEIDSLNSKINTYNMTLIDLEKQISTDSEALKVLLAGKKPFSSIDLDDKNNIKLNVPLNSGDTGKIIEINIDSSNDLQNALITIKATEIETRLIQNKAEKETLESKSIELEKRLKDMQTLLAEEEYKYNTVKRNYNLAEQTYNAYLDRHKEAVLAATSNIGESAIIVSEEASIPIDPSNFGKLFYLVAGAFIGVILGVITAFVLSYWKYTDPRNNSRNRVIN